MLGQFEGYDKGLLLPLGAVMLHPLVIDPENEIFLVDALSGALGKAILLAVQLKDFLPFLFCIGNETGRQVDFRVFFV